VPEKAPTGQIFRSSTTQVDCIGAVPFGKSFAKKYFNFMKGESNEKTNDWK
jgi:hypothetical protein